jgi:hypothetical protein
MILLQGYIPHEPDTLFYPGSYVIAGLMLLFLGAVAIAESDSWKFKR